MNTSIIEKQLMEMSDYEKKYSGTPEHPRHYSHLEDLELTFSTGIQAPDIVPVDYFFNYCYGKLPYRSIDFKFETVDAEYYQPTGTVNYPNEHPYTRITDFKYLTGQKHPKTTIVYEYPKAVGDPYYPVPRPENAEIYKKYQQLTSAMTNTYFVGRLATYKYYNMDQVVAQSLTLFKKLMQRQPETHVNGQKVTKNKLQQS